MATHGQGLVKAFQHLAAHRSSNTIVMSANRAATIDAIDRLSKAIVDSDMLRLEPGRLVGLSVANGPTFLAGLLALWRSGHAALLLDAMAPPQDQWRAMRMLGASALLSCTAAWPDSTQDYKVTYASSDVVPYQAQGVSVVKLTSGSTGFPRGVAMSDDSLLADEAALASTMGIREDDRLLATIPWSHSYGFTTLVLSALVRGVPLILPSSDGPLSPLISGRDLNATVFPTVPAYIQALLRMSRTPALPDAMRLVISAGAPLPPLSAQRFRAIYQQPVHAFYGSSECGGICYDRDGGAGERGTVGTPVDGVRVSLVPSTDASSDSTIVAVESAAVGDSYLPTTDMALGLGRFQTNDIGSWRGGELALGVRIDRVINVRGRKVDPSEVEEVLVGLHGVDEAVVLGLDMPGGRGEMVRAVIATSSKQLDYADIVTWCRGRLAEYKIPRSIIVVDAIPRTARGKIDRVALHALPSTDRVSRTPHG